jgi:hypothetical protein
LVSGPRINFVAEFESTHAGADTDNDSGHVAPQNDRQAIPQEGLEVALSDSRIDGVHASRVDLDHHVTLLQLGRGRVAGAHAVGASVTIEYECLHGSSMESE